MRLRSHGASLGLCGPHSVLSDKGECAAALCGGMDTTDGSLMLCCHEILMVKEAKKGGGKEAGSDPPSEEGEEAPKK